MIKLYFTDLTNNELNNYHKMARVAGFSADLDIMRSSSLFKVINLGSDLYKCIPLFYYDEIRCNSDSVKILGNKAVIIQDDDNSYIDFTGTAVYYEDNTQREDYIHDIRSHGDDLSESEFNNLVYLMKKNVTFKDPLKIKNDTITGDYGVYEFNITDATIIDNGILLRKTSSSILSELSVKLTNSYFKDAKYTLVLDVRSISDVNLNMDNTSDYVHHNIIRQELTPETIVNIDFSSLSLDYFNYVILFDAYIEISNDKPLLNTADSEFMIDSITSSPDEPVVVTAKLARTSNADTLLNVLINGTPCEDIIIPAGDLTASVTDTTFTTENKVLAVQLYNPSTNKYCLIKYFDKRYSIPRYEVSYRRKYTQLGLTLQFNTRVPITPPCTRIATGFTVFCDSDNIHNEYQNVTSRGCYLEYNNNPWIDIGAVGYTSEEYTFKIVYDGSDTVKPLTVEKTVTIGGESSGSFVINTD